MRNRDEKCLDGLTAQDSARSIRHRAGNNERHALSRCFEQLANRGDRSFRVERVEDRFDEKQIDAAFEERSGLLTVGFPDLVKIRGTKTRIVHVRRERRRDGQGTHGAAYETPAPRFLCHALRSPQGVPGRLAVIFFNNPRQFLVVDDALKKLEVFSTAGRFAFEKKIVETDRSAAKSVRLDNVRAGFEVIPMNLLDHVRSGKEEDFEAAFEIFARPVFEAIAAKLGLTELALLDHGAHGAVEDDDALAHERFERMESVARHGEPELTAVPVHGKEQIDAS